MTKTYLLAAPGSPKKMAEGEIQYIVDALQPDGESETFSSWCAACELGEVWYGSRNMVVVRIKDSA